MMAIRCIWLCALCSVMGLILRAQVVDTPVIQTDFSVYLWPGSDMATYRAVQTEEEKALGLLPAYRAPEFFYAEMGEKKSIRMIHSRQTSFFRYQGTPRIEFYSKSETPEGTVWIMQGHADIPPYWSRVLLIGVAAPADSAEPFLFFPINLSEGDSTPFSGQLFNLSKRTLYARVGGQDLLLPPRKLVSIDLKSTKDFLLPFVFAAEEGKGKRIVYSSTRPIVPDQNPLFIVFAPDPERADLRMLALDRK